jgi:hypothetical protein
MIICGRLQKTPVIRETLMPRCIARLKGDGRSQRGGLNALPAPTKAGRERRSICR